MIKNNKSVQNNQKFHIVSNYLTITVTTDIQINIRLQFRFVATTPSEINVVIYNWAFYTQTKMLHHDTNLCQEDNLQQKIQFCPLHIFWLVIIIITTTIRLIFPIELGLVAH